MGGDLGRHEPRGGRRRRGQPDRARPRRRARPDARRHRGREGGDHQAGEDRRRPRADRRGERGDPRPLRRSSRRRCCEDRDWAVEERVPAVGGQSLRGPRCARPTRTSCCRCTASTRRTTRPPRSSRSRRSRASRSTRTRCVARSQPRRSPGRLEVVGAHPLIMLDGAHNPAGRRRSPTAMPEAFTWERLQLVVGVFANKDLDGIVERLAPLADVVYAYATRSVRARPATEVAAAIASRGRCGADLRDRRPRRRGGPRRRRPGDLILVTGSLYTVADARRVAAGGTLRWPSNRRCSS